MGKWRHLVAFAGTLLASTSSWADTLDDIRARGYLHCGVTPGLTGFGSPDENGRWEGFDIDFCRGVAAAIFGDKEKIRFTSLSSKERFTALQTGEVDLLYRNTTMSFMRDVNLGLDFPSINYYDGQGFMVPIELGVSSATDLDGARICIQAGTTTELNLSDYFLRNEMTYESVVVADDDEARMNYLAGACDAYTTDASGLAAVRAAFPDPAAHIILPEIVSKEPLGPIVRHGDNKWGDVIRWTFYAMIAAEEMGVTSENVDQMLTSENPEVRRLLGTEGEFGAQLGLEKNWAYNIIKNIGNYGEVFERNIGKDSALQLERGLNGLWTQGGLMYSPPIR